MVAPDTENAPDYSSTDFLKLSGPNGTWNTKFGGQDAAGKGVVVGVIDTGYTPDSAFFAGEAVKPLVGRPRRRRSLPDGGRQDRDAQGRRRNLRRRVPEGCGHRR